MFEYSVQQILDCINATNLNYTCSGNVPKNVFNYIQKAGGLATEAVYPLRSDLVKGEPKISHCKSNIENLAVEVSGGSKDIKPYDERSFLEKLL